jgi:hypothetical protein
MAIDGKIKKINIVKYTGNKKVLNMKNSFYKLLYIKSYKVAKVDEMESGLQKSMREKEQNIKSKEKVCCFLLNFFFHYFCCNLYRLFIGFTILLHYFCVD